MPSGSSFPIAGCFPSQIFRLHAANQNIWRHGKKCANGCPLLLGQFHKCLYYTERLPTTWVPVFPNGSLIPTRRWLKGFQQPVDAFPGGFPHKLAFFSFPLLKKFSSYFLTIKDEREKRFFYFCSF